jgi:hypothetical protein
MYAGMLFGDYPIEIKKNYNKKSLSVSINKDYIIKLLEKNKIGLLIKIMNENIHKWSMDDFLFVFNYTFLDNDYNCIDFDQHIENNKDNDPWFSVTYYMIECFRSSIKFKVPIIKISYHVIEALIKNRYNKIIKYLFRMYPNYWYHTFFKQSCMYDNIEVNKLIMNVSCIKDNDTFCRDSLLGAYKNKNMNVVKYTLLNVNLYPFLVLRESRYGKQYLDILMSI